MTNEQIKQIALANGFKLKQQASGEMDLNPYVYDFANALINNWISVTERLPDEKQPVLVYSPTSNTQAVMYRDYGDLFLASDLYGGDRFTSGEHEITHWQPLPQPPEGE